MKMELDKHPWIFLLRVDKTMKKLERVKRLMDLRDVDTVIRSCLTSLYDTKFRRLEGSSDWFIREWIKRAVINQCGRLHSEKSSEGRGNGRKSTPPSYALAQVTQHKNVEKTSSSSGT